MGKISQINLCTLNYNFEGLDVLLDDLWPFINIHNSKIHLYSKVFKINNFDACIKILKYYYTKFAAFHNFNRERDLYLPFLNALSDCVKDVDLQYLKDVEPRVKITINKELDTPIKKFYQKDNVLFRLDYDDNDHYTLEEWG